MSSFAKRLLLTLTAVPAIFCLIWFLPYYHHLAFALLVLAVTIYATFEVQRILFDQERPLIPFWLSALLPIGEYLKVCFHSHFPVSEFLLIFLLILLFIVEVKGGDRDDFASSQNRIALTTFMFIYPGYLTQFFIRYATFSFAKEALVLLFLLVFGNDVFAYLFGMWLGRGNKNIFKASPNKSIAGFVGGFLSALLLSFFYIRFVPPFSTLLNSVQALVIATVIVFTAILGDLVESVLKRGAGKKDSGTIIQGRGGLMDSIDSLLLSAPVLFLLLSLFITTG